MKALVISDDEKTLSFIDSKLKSGGIDSINYKWLLKALDNVEEIQPDLIVINVFDYPRHWKTLVQFVRGCFDNFVRVYLYVPQDFSDDEKKKAGILGITDFYTSLEVMADNFPSLKTQQEKKESKDGYPEEKTESTNEESHSVEKKINSGISGTEEDFPLYTVDNILESFSEDFVLFTCNNIVEEKENDSVKHWGSLLKKIQGIYEK